MTDKAVNRLIDKYLEGKTSPEEERRLALEVNRPDALVEWQAIGEMLGELTLGEAVYENTLARRRRRRVNLYMGWAAAACIAIMVVSGYWEYRKMPAPSRHSPSGEVTVQTKTSPMSQPSVAMPQEEVQQTAFVPKARRKRARNSVATTVMAEERVEVQEVEETSATVPTMEVSEEEMAQVEQGFQRWKLRQSVFDEGIELRMATERLNRKYEEFLAANKDNIEI